MKVAILRDIKSSLSIEDISVPEPEAGQLLVKLQCCGVCHSDLHIVDGDWPVDNQLPLVPGHEGIGEIVALGDSVRHWKTGERVGVPLINKACGECDLCQAGAEPLCGKIILTGFHINGCFAEYALVDAGFAVALPENKTSEQLAPILCAGVTVYRGIKQSNLKPGQWLSIWGIGGLGHVAVQYAKALGLNVVAIDIDDDKLSMAMEYGADACCNSLKNAPIEALKQICGGPHGALVTATNIKAFQQAYSSLRPNGVLTPLGIPPGSLTLEMGEYMSRQISIKGSSVGSRDDMKECMSFVADNLVIPRVSVYPFDQINDVLNRLRENNILGRAVIDISSP